MKPYEVELPKRYVKVELGHEAALGNWVEIGDGYFYRPETKRDRAACEDDGHEPIDSNHARDGYSERDLEPKDQKHDEEAQEDEMVRQIGRRSKIDRTGREELLKRS